MKENDKSPVELNIKDFEETFKEKTKGLEQARKEYYESHQSEQRKLRHHHEEVTVAKRSNVRLHLYQAMAAVNKYDQAALRKESGIHRTWRLIRDLTAQKKLMKGKYWFTHERRRDAYANIFKDCWAPAYEFCTNFIDDFWSFLCELGSDFIDCLLFAGDLIIKIFYYAISVLLYLWDWIWDIRFWLERHKRILFSIFVIGVSVTASWAVLMNSITAYEYSYHGKTLGIVKSPEDVYSTVDILGDKLSEASGMAVYLDAENDISFEKVYGFRMDVDSRDEVLNTITYMRNLQVKAYAVAVDGKQLVILESPEVAERLLDSIKRDFISVDNNTLTTSVSFVEEVEVQEVGVALGDIWNAVDAKHYLEKGVVKEEVTVAKPLINVATVEEYTSLEDVDYGTKYISNANLYSDETELVSPGVKGQNSVVSQISRLNGQKTDSIVLSTTRVSDPVDEVMYQGTKPIPPSDGTGTFIYPTTNYYISSRYGPRWGGFHSGVDFATATGTKIVASDGGTVTFAGWKGTYGYCVIVDHGGLYETLYGHCSKILVNVGDEVYQDKTIALVGSTGRSTGPHLHFEIHYKGEALNPLTLLP